MKTKLITFLIFMLGSQGAMCLSLNVPKKIRFSSPFEFFDISEKKDLKVELSNKLNKRYKIKLETGSFGISKEDKENYYIVNSKNFKSQILTFMKGERKMVPIELTDIPKYPALLVLKSTIPGETGSAFEKIYIEDHKDIKNLQMYRQYSLNPKSLRIRQVLANKSGSFLKGSKIVTSIVKDKGVVWNNNKSPWGIKRRVMSHDGEEQYLTINTRFPDGKYKIISILVSPSNQRAILSDSFSIKNHKIKYKNKLKELFDSGKAHENKH